MMNKYLGILALAALPPSVAAASQFHHVPGSICTVSFGTNESILRGPQVENVATTGVSLSCPIPFTSTSVNPVTVNPATGRVDYGDYNSASGYFGPGAISCTLKIVTSTNTTVSGGAVFSCATPGGCASGDNTYTGINYLTLPDNIASTANVVGMSVDCGMPGYDSVYGWSGIFGIAVSTTAP